MYIIITLSIYVRNRHFADVLLEKEWLDARLRHLKNAAP